jgi:hypothetical protein
MTIATNSLAKETTTTTGTGNYTLAGASSGFRALSTVVTPGANAILPCIIVMGAEFERGIYRLSASNTLVRVKVLESSNGNAAVNWTSGTKEVMCAPAMSGVALGRHNFQGGATLPTTTDNYAEGYAHGSLWFYAYSGGDDRSVWICRNPGTPSSPNAEWTQLNANAEYITDEAGAVPFYGVKLGPADDMTETAAQEGVVAVGFGGKSLWNNALLKGHGYTDGYGGAQSVVSVGLWGETANDAPLNLTNAGPWADNELAYLAIPVSSAITFTGRITARCETTGDCKFWEVKFGIKRASTGDPSMVGSLTKTVIAADAGASTWDVDIVIDTANDGISVEVTGAAATTIRWSADLRACQVGFMVYE